MNNPGRVERGVTLVEVTVALLVFTMGVVALAGLAATVARMVNRGVTATQLAARISERLEILQAGACRATASGSTGRGPLEVRWRVTADGDDRRITMSAGNMVITRYVVCGL